MGEGMDTPIPIGTTLDLSGKGKVYKPIPTDELDESPGPLPGYWVLNDEGVLSAWWVVYSESVREGTTYPGLAAVEGNATTVTAATPSQAAQPNPFSSPTTSAFGSLTQTSKPAFGGPSALGGKASPWAAGTGTGTGAGTGTGGSAFGSSSFGTSPASSTPAFGKPSFGAPSALRAPPSFGQSSGLGSTSSPWASASASGQSPFANMTSGSGSGSGSPFGASSSNNAPASGGFASFANKGGFAQVGPSTDASAPSIFASPSKSEAPEVSMDNGSSTAFASSSSRSNIGSGNPFATQPFKLQSTFQRDPHAKDDDHKADQVSTGGNSMFGSNFGSMLGEAAQSPKPNPFASATKSVFGQSSAPSSAESTTPTSTPAPNKFLSQVSSPPKSSGIFGMPSKDTTTPTSSFTSIATAYTPTDPVPGIKVEATTPKPLRDIPDAPLPPESTSKATFPLGDSSSSSASSAGQPENTLFKAKGAPLPPESPTASVDDAPLPPDPIQNKKIYDVKPPPLPETVTKGKSVDDAPLPPDPIKNKKLYDDIPPLPDNVVKRKPADDAPLPPDPVKESKAYDAKFPILPDPDSKPTPSSVLPGPKTSDKPFVFPSNPPPVLTDSDDDDDDDDDDDEDDGELSDEGTEAASEGSGVDVAKDLSPSITGINKTPGYTPQSSFDGLAGSFSTISRPDHERRGLFGEISRNAPVFAQPNVVSPRSPSPVRNVVPTKLLGKEQTRSFSTPAMASQLLGAARRQQGAIGSTIASKVAATEDHIIEQQRKAKAKKQAEESQLLVDEEDDSIQQLLQSDIQPTLVLDEFIAHSGAAAPAGDSIPAQVEAVYRDINSMIDTLGLNARSLTGFIDGHRKFGHETVSKDDLASPDGWTLDEIQKLTFVITRDLDGALRAAAVAAVDVKLERCAELQRDLARDRNKQADLKKIIASRVDPEQAVANRVLPLTAEQAAQQTDLRREFARFAKLLAEAEENLTLLKARIVSAGGGGFGGGAIGVGGGGGNKVGGPAPTIEAVMRTITKMTSMVEKRSGDIDVLETQMRKLRLGSAGGSSREGSPFVASVAGGGGPPTTPNSKRLSASMLFSPERSVREGTPQHHRHRSSIFRQSLSGSVSLAGTPLRTPPRKKLTESGFGEAEKAAVKEKRGRRALVLGKLRGSLLKKGVSVWAVEGLE